MPRQICLTSRVPAVVSGTSPFAQHYCKNRERSLILLEGIQVKEIEEKHGVLKILFFNQREEEFL